MAAPIYVIIVTHDSAAVLDTCLSHLEKQTIAAQEVIVVDSGSSDKGYLEKIAKYPGLRLITTDNIGYGRANNLGFEQLRMVPDGMAIFCNPDTFLPPDFLAQALVVLRENPGAGAISGKLLGFNPLAVKPTGRIDSAGIYRSWFGRWFDRGQGKKDVGQFDLIASPPALCGALLCCRIRALHSLGEPVFDPDFFLYKEDIELCLRLKKKGWSLIYDPRLIAYHCRGWSEQRQNVSYRLRLTAAESEVLLYRKHPGPHILWAWLKYIAVRFLRL